MSGQPEAFPTAVVVKAEHMPRSVTQIRCVLTPPPHTHDTTRTRHDTHATHNANRSFFIRSGAVTCLASAWPSRAPGERKRCTSTRRPTASSASTRTRTCHARERRSDLLSPAGRCGVILFLCATPVRRDTQVFFMFFSRPCVVPLRVRCGACRVVCVCVCVCAPLGALGY